MAMTQKQREAILREARAELHEAQVELTAAQRRVLNLQQVIRGMSGLLNPGQDEPSEWTTEQTISSNSSMRRFREARARAEEAIRMIDSRRADLHGSVTSERSIESIEAKEPLAVEDGTGDVPRPRDAILEVLSSTPNIPMQPREVVNMIRTRGIFDNKLKSGSNGYTTALIRLAEDPTSPIGRGPNGMYTYQDPYPGPAATSEGDLIE